MQQIQLPPGRGRNQHYRTITSLQVRLVISAYKEQVTSLPRSCLANPNHVLPRQGKGKPELLHLHADSLKNGFESIKAKMTVENWNLKTRKV